jgi:DNA-binding response OmpR family regulator
VYRQVIGPGVQKTLGDQRSATRPNEENLVRENSANSVLLVDDDPSMRELLSSRLEAAGFEARQAEDGIDGLVKLRDELPEVIISDIQMPRMSGVEFVSVVRHRFPSIPVIILSGSSPVELPTEAEPDAWFEKGPLQFRELLQSLRDLVRKTPDRADVPQVVNTPVRTRPCGAGEFVLTCPDCLRRFQVMSRSENKTAERTAVCAHCEAHVPFLVESSEPA